MKNGGFLIGLFLGAVGFIGYCAHVIMKVVQGDGLEHYFTGFGYQFNYIGTLILLGLIPIFLILALILRRYQRRDERDFKDKYLK